MEELFQTLASKIEVLEVKAATSEDLEKTEKALKALEERYNLQVGLQEQKDAAQDEILAMRFDSMKRDLQNYVRNQDLEEQKGFIVTKVHHIDIEMKDAIKSLGTSLREEVSRDARKLQEQLEKVSAAVVNQLKMVDNRLRDNVEADTIFEKLVADRLARVEAELRIEPPNGSPMGSPHGGPPEAPAGGYFGGGLAQESKAQESKAAAKASPREVQRVEARVDEVVVELERLRRVFEEEKQRVTEQLDPAHPGMVASSKLERRISTLEDRVDDVSEKEVELTRKIEHVKEHIERPPNPLDWLEERVGELARKRGGERVDVIQRLGEVTGRLKLLENQRDEAALALRELPSEGGCLDAEPQLLVLDRPAGQRVQDPSDSSEGDAALSKRSISERASQSLSVRRSHSAVEVDSPHLSYVNLFEDMERLRCIIECMEETMPLEVRRSIQFFKGSRKDGGRNASSRGGGSRGDKAKPRPGLELEAEVLGLRTEAEEQSHRVQRCEDVLARESANVLKVVRGIEREQDQMKLKVDDMWQKLPQLAAILAPLQLQLSRGNDAAVPELHVQAETAIEALKPLSGLLEASLQKAIEKLRQDVVSGLVEVKNEVGTKASVSDFTLLKDRVEKWSRSRTPSPKSGSLTPYKMKALERELALETDNRKLARGLERCKTAAGHERCKATTAPFSASTGRLPVLSKTR